MSVITILLILCAYFTKSYSQCDSDKYYKYYHNLIQIEKDNIKQVFDRILEKYGDVDTNLENLLIRLNNTVNKADLGLNILADNNDKIENINNDSNAALQSLLKDMKGIDDGLKQINISRNWPEDLEIAEKIAKTIIPHLQSVNITEPQNELERWKTFLEGLKGQNFTKDLMNLPHSVSDELTMLEKLITEKNDTNCFDKFHNDIKVLFIELFNLLDFKVIVDDLNAIKEKASRNEKGANNILSTTKGFLEKEKQLGEVLRLTNETLLLAAEIEKLNDDIKKLEEHNEDVVNARLKKIQENHEAETEKLNEKYNVKEGQSLLNKLKRTKQQIEDVDIEQVEKDMDKYLQDIDYYTCILEKCESGSQNITDCKTEE